MCFGAIPNIIQYKRSGERLSLIGTAQTKISSSTKNKHPIFYSPHARKLRVRLRVFTPREWQFYKEFWNKYSKENTKGVAPRENMNFWTYVRTPLTQLIFNNLFCVRWNLKKTIHKE